jgi:hypothetical protein
MRLAQNQSAVVAAVDVAAENAATAGNFPIPQSTFCPEPPEQ